MSTMTTTIRMTPPSALTINGTTNNNNNSHHTATKFKVVEFYRNNNRALLTSRSNGCSTTTNQQQQTSNTTNNNSLYDLLGFEIIGGYLDDVPATIVNVAANAAAHNRKEVKVCVYYVCVWIFKELNNNNTAIICLEINI